MRSNAGYLVPDGDPPPRTDGVTVLSSGAYELVQLPLFHTYRPQGRPDFQLLYLAAGSATFTVAGETRVVAPGTAVLYAPGELQDYRYTAAERPRVFWVHVAGDQAAALFAGCGMASGWHQVGVHARYETLFSRLIAELQRRRPLCREMTAALLLELVAEMVRQEQAAQGAPRSEMVEQAVAYLWQHLDRPLSMRELAHQLHVEPCWFSRRFRQQMGLPPGQYLQQMRLDRARELLATTTLPVGEVARLVGYDNPLYFSRLFRQAVGCAPRTFRKQKEE